MYYLLYFRKRYKNLTLKAKITNITHVFLHQEHKLKELNRIFYALFEPFENGIPPVLKLWAKFTGLEKNGDCQSSIQFTKSKPIFNDIISPGIPVFCKCLQNTYVTFIRLSKWQTSSAFERTLAHFLIMHISGSHKEVLFFFNLVLFITFSLHGDFICVQFSGKCLKGGGAKGIFFLS